MAACRICLLLLCLCSCWNYPVTGSLGDDDPAFHHCVHDCDFTNCSAQNHGGEMTGSSVPSKFGTGFPYWTCTDDCVYDCMQMITNYRAQIGLGPYKYYGHWPFIRLYGLEEPASVLFSLLNGVPYLWNLFSSGMNILYGGRSTFVPVVHAATMNIPPSSMKDHLPTRQQQQQSCYYYMQPWLVLYYLIGINTWVCSALFHARKTPQASLIDYISALLFLMYSLWIAGRRIWGPSAPSLTVTLVFYGYMGLYAWQVIRMCQGWVPFHQHMQLCIAISVAIVVTWSIWIIKPWMYRSNNNSNNNNNNSNKNSNNKNNNNDYSGSSSSGNNDSNSGRSSTNNGSSSSSGSHSSSSSSSSNSSSNNSSSVASNQHHHRYRYLCLLCQIWFSLAALLEIFDFPALYGHFDAHSLWHLATIPLGFIWAIFWRLDAAEHIGGGSSGSGGDSVNVSNYPVIDNNASFTTTSMDDGHIAVVSKVRTRSRTKATSKDKG